MAFEFNWKPKGATLMSCKQTRITDGDTPYVEMSIRMLSIDAPEVHYPSRTKPSSHNGALRKLAPRLLAGEFAGVGTKLGKYLAERIEDGRAGTRQLEQGTQATREYRRMLDERLARPSGRSRRMFFCRTSSEKFDSYGRLLAYVAPDYNKEERAQLSLHERRTFNLQLVEEGWAAPFVIYPSLGRTEDMKLFRKAAASARKKKLGIYADPLSLTGYEFRLCVKLALGKSTGPIRFCADLSKGKLYEPDQYLKVLPENRMFVWKKDVRAVTKLGFVQVP